MLSTNVARRATRCLPRTRPFSTTTAAQAISPHRKHNAHASQHDTPARRNVSATAKSNAQAATQAASQQRAVPSPAFNRAEYNKDVQPLQPFRQPEMDHSFVGMKGGEIFHEMMLRHGVKHVCESTRQPSPTTQVIHR
jgi:acetolactate synthase-1/2/3 large subunit